MVFGVGDLDRDLLEDPWEDEPEDLAALLLRPLLLAAELEEDFPEEEEADRDFLGIKN